MEPDENFPKEVCAYCVHSIEHEEDCYTFKCYVDSDTEPVLKNVVDTCNKFRDHKEGV